MTTRDDHGLSQAIAQAQSIAAMVNALDVDYDRLEELRDQVKAHQAAKAEADEAIENVKRHHSDVPLEEALERDYPECIEARELIEALEDNPALDESDAEELRELEENAGEYDSQDEAREAIQQDALEVQVRNDWHNPGETDNTPTEFYILLCTGGPAVRIMGEIDEHGDPSRAWIEYQDWGTPWTHLVNAPVEDESLLTYCREYVFAS